MRHSFRETQHVLTAKRAHLSMCAFAIIAMVALLGVLNVGNAFADVRKSDVVAGKTVEERSLPAINCPSIDAEHAIVVDSDGAVYFERDAHSPAQIASITKVMTAVTALDYAPLDTRVVVSSRAAEVGESSAHLMEGDELTLDLALKALMMPSGNDAAVAIAESVGAMMVSDAQAKGAEIVSPVTGAAIDLNAEDAAFQAFVCAMNEKASELGCEDSVFTNPHGLDDGEWAGDLHSTAADVALIVAHAMSNDNFRQVVSNEEATIEVKRDGESARIEIESTDLLLGTYEGACGVKTGFTDLAGACFAGAVSKEGKELYSVVLDSTSEAKRFEDTTALWDWVYGNLVKFQLANSDETVTCVIGGEERTVPVIAEVPHRAWIDKTVKATFSDPDAYVEVFALRGNVSQSFEPLELMGDVRAGDVVGSMTFYQANEVVCRQDLIACEDMTAPGPFEGIGIWWERLLRSFSGEAEYADSKVLNELPLIYDKQKTYSTQV